MCYSRMSADVVSTCLHYPLVASSKHPGCAMSTVQLIQLSLIALVCAYAPVGAWRGGFREGVLGGGLVITGALIIFPPIVWLGGSLQDRVDSGRLLVALACLGVGLALGVGAGRIVERHAASARGRLVGAICGLANAVWICTYLLVELERAFALPGFGGRLTDGLPFGPMVTHTEATLLALSTLVLFLSGIWTVYLLWGRLGSGADPTSRWTPRLRADSRHRAVRFPIGADAGKVEPMGGNTTIRLANTVSLSREAAARRRPEDRYVRAWKSGRESRQGDASRTRRVSPEHWYEISFPPASRDPHKDEN